MQSKIIIAGATGLVGSELLRLALADPEVGEVISLVRKSSGIANPKLTEEIIDFDYLESHHLIVQGDAVFCCLGTTIKKAGSKDNFRKVDFHYPRELAKIGKKNNVPQFNIVTAMGADAKSSIFYNKVKGEVEEAIIKLKIDSTNIFRPSLLMGDRKESRKGEKIGIALAKIINPLMVGPLRKYRGIKATDVARAMLINSKTTKEGLHIFSSDQIYDIAANDI